MSLALDSPRFPKDQIIVEAVSPLTLPGSQTPRSTGDFFFPCDPFTILHKIPCLSRPTEVLSVVSVAVNTP